MPARRHAVDSVVHAPVVLQYIGAPLPGLFSESLPPSGSSCIETAEECVAAGAFRSLQRSVDSSVKVPPCCNSLLKSLLELKKEVDEALSVSLEVWPSLPKPTRGPPFF
ncbi:hypothetical protein cyc_07759 [Cyclospora cayetanensis]|uniref:Uncharacterized protein n=1 Tax=Cyclospora cayetanensis TaxID=88456 RepID=A0A1D3D1S1_9EIME|nr:hypothetical protein cyc_07759 [Cyclospora cayetanensis]